jgi:small subunit ribosomal protein S1
MTEPTKQPERDDRMSSEDYENLLDRYQYSTKEITMGKILKGRVIKTTPTHVLVDVGFKTEGLIPNEEFTDPAVLEALKPGDEVDTMLERTDLKDGYLVLSKRQADGLLAIESLDQAFEHGLTVTGTVTERTRGGFNVDVGIPAFLPESHADLRPIRDASGLIGQTLKFRVIKFDRKTENAVLSRKLVLQEERETKRKHVFGGLAKGQKVTGRVKSLTNFGAFVDLGGIEGLLHVSDIAWGKSAHPSEHLTVGQEVEVVVLDFNERDEKISLGLKQLTPDPWANIAEKYQAGQKITGKVSSLTDFGAFVELEKGVEGLVHISDISWEKVKHPSEKLQVGQEVETIVLNIDVDRQKVSLGIKQLEGDIWEDFFIRQKVGDVVKVKIVRLTDFGAFVEIMPGIEGVVFTAELDEKKIEKPSDAFAVGDERNAKIIKMNPKAKKISLSFKQAVYDLEKQDFQRFMESQNDRMTLGDIMRDQLKGFKAPKRKGTKKEDTHD